MKIMLDDVELKQIENFVYLGGSVSADQSRDKDIERRIGLAAGIVRNLDNMEGPGYHQRNQSDVVPYLSPGHCIV